MNNSSSAAELATENACASFCKTLISTQCGISLEPGHRWESSDTLVVFVSAYNNTAEVRSSIKKLEQLGFECVDVSFSGELRVSNCLEVYKSDRVSASSTEGSFSQSSLLTIRVLPVAVAVLAIGLFLISRDSDAIYLQQTWQQLHREQLTTSIRWEFSLIAGALRVMKILGLL